MAINTVEKINQSDTGADSFSTGGAASRSYQEVWQAIADDETTTVDDVLNDGRLPQLGNAAINGVQLRQRACRRRSDQSVRKLFEVTLTYSNELTEDEPQDSDGNPTDDPTRDKGSVSVSKIIKRKAIPRAVYIGLVDSDGNNIADDPGPLGSKWVRGDTLPVNNAAETPTEPFLEIDKPISIYRTSSVWPSWDNDWSTYDNTVNDREQQIDWFVDGGQITFGPFAIHTLKCDNVGADDFLYANQTFMRRIIEFHYDPDGWYEDVANRGKMAIIRPGDPKVGGGTWSSSEITSSYVSTTDAIKGTDLEGDTVLEDRWLDARGKFIKEFDPAQAIFIRWLTRRAVNLQPILVVTPFG